MYKRPLPVSVVGWVFVLVGLLNFANTGRNFLILQDDPVYKQLSPATSTLKPQDVAMLDTAFWTIIAFAVLGEFLEVIAGMLILAGSNWMRIIYAAICALVVVYHLALSNFAAVFTLQTFSQALAIALLYSPNSNKYFSVEGI